MAQYSWPPCTNQFRSAPFYIENIINLFYKTGYLNEEANCTEPFPLVSIPWLWIPSLWPAHMTIVNDSGIVSKWSSNLFDDARFVIYDHQMFIVQATGEPTLSVGHGKVLPCLQMLDSDEKAGRSNRLNVFVRSVGDDVKSVW
jgi:hypothetical protein